MSFVESALQAICVSLSGLARWAMLPLILHVFNYPQEFLKVGRPKTCDRIPSNDSGEAIGPAARVRTRCDVVEARQSTAVQPWIQETKRVLALGNSVVIEQRDNPSYCRRRTARAPSYIALLSVDDNEIHRLGRDVGIAAALCPRTIDECVK